MAWDILGAGALAVLAAMPEEIAPLQQAMKLAEAEEAYGNRVVHIWQGRLSERPVLLVQTGIGKANAAAAAAIVLERFAPRALLNIGSAGGFARDLHFGDVVVGTECAYSDAEATCFGYAPGQVPQMPAAYPAAPELLAAARELAGEVEFAGHLRFGPILTSDAFMSDPALADRLRKVFPRALASDMEGTAIAQIAYTYGAAFMNLRSISDIAGDQAEKSFDENLELAAGRASRFLQALLARI